MEEKTSKTKYWKFIIGGAIVLIVVAFSVVDYIKKLNFENTDNAQIDGDILAIRAGVTGYVSSIRFKDNQEVKKGDTLIVFDTTELISDINRINAELENSKLNWLVSGSIADESLQKVSAAIFESDSNFQEVQSARASYNKAVLNLDRAKKLLEIKGITQTRFEELQAELEIVKASFLKAKALKKSSSSTYMGLRTRAATEKKKIGVAKNIILQKQAELAVAREKLRHAFVTAPFSGIVTKRNVQAGQFINAGQSLCALINHKDLWIIANFKENQINEIKPGQTVEIFVDAYRKLKLTGTVDSYGGATGSRFAIIPPDNATGNFIKIAQRFPIRIKLDRYNGKDDLFPGLSVDVKVKVH